MTVKVSPKYQVVIPKEVRKSLDIRPGMKISVIAKGGIAYLVPVRTIEEIQASLTPALTTKEKRKIHRGLREKKDRKL